MRAFLSAAPRKRNSRVGGTYSVPLAELGAEELEAEKKRLTLQVEKYRNNSTRICEQELARGHSLL